VTGVARLVVHFLPLEIDVRGSLSGHVASSGALDAGVECLVVTCCASDDPMFCPVKEPMALFV